MNMFKVIGPETDRIMDLMQNFTFNAAMTATSSVLENRDVTLQNPKDVAGWVDEYVRILTQKQFQPAWDAAVAADTQSERKTSDKKH